MPLELDVVTPLIADLPLHPALLSAAATLNYVEATPVQAQAIPVILQGRDVLVSALTGSGKTVAFLLPSLHQILNTGRGTQLLILAPTRELAQQIAGQCRDLTSLTDLKFGLITGGDDFKKQQRLLFKQAEIIIATPGRLLEHLEQTPRVFENLHTLILDEADRMLDMGFIQDVQKIAESCQGRKQTLLFSATLSHSGVMRMASTLACDPVRVVLNTVQDPHTDIRQQVIPCDDQAHKQSVLLWLLENEPYDKAIIFTNFKLLADQLRGPLRGRKLRVGVLHGDLDQSERNQVMALYRDGTINILIATDIAGRGLDVNGIDLVVNFDMPRTGHHYVHRIGRTGRIGRQGLAISLVNPNEWNLMSGIERYLKQSFTRRNIEEVEGRFKGPKKLKSSGKAVGVKQEVKPKKEAVKKPKQRERVTKNIGKRRKASAPLTAED